MYGITLACMYVYIYIYIFPRDAILRVEEISVRNDPVSNDCISEWVNQIARNGKANLFITMLRRAIIARILFFLWESMPRQDKSHLDSQ